MIVSKKLLKQKTKLTKKKINKLRGLAACEESQAVCKAFRNLGHEFYSCDLRPCSGGHPEWHLQQDVLPLLELDWDIIIAFPPCTYLSHMGAVRLFKDKHLNLERYLKGIEARDFFTKFYNCECKKIAIENPQYSTIYQLPKHSQVINPWQFGHPYCKKTLLWLKGLPYLRPTKIMYERSPAMKSRWFGHCQGDRSLHRSKLFPGIAQAMAEQWGGQCE